MLFFTGGIAFFDSGIGGLTVLQNCIQTLQGQTIYYYGDNCRAPYGNLPKEKIFDYVLEAFDVFSQLQVDGVVLACNTVTALCIDELRKRYPFPIIGIEPAILSAAKHGGDILLLCTKRTSESERLQRLTKKAKEKYPDAHIRIAPCEKLAGAVEKSPFVATENLSDYLPQGKADGVVLGCTHYLYYKKYIEEFYQCPVYDANESVNVRLSKLLNENISKNRENRPLDDNFLLKTHFFDSEPFIFSHPHSFLKYLSQKDSEQKNAYLKRKKIEENAGETRVYFLGSGQKNNKTVYKQMFAFMQKG